MMRLMTPDEYLMSLKAEGYEYFELDDNFYQYEMGQLFIVFGKDVLHPIVSSQLSDFSTVQMPEDYLSIKGVTNDYVAFFVAYKKQIILLDENHLPMGSVTQEEFGNDPSDYKHVVNMMVEYGRPGYYDNRFSPPGGFRKVFHNGQFFYNGFERTTKDSYFTYRFERLSRYEVDLMYGELYTNEDHESVQPKQPSYKTAEDAFVAMLEHMKEVREEIRNSDMDPGAMTAIFRNAVVSECCRTFMGEVFHKNQVVMAGPYDYEDKMMFTVSTIQNEVFPIENINAICKRLGYHEPTKVLEQPLGPGEYNFQNLAHRLRPYNYAWRPVGYIAQFEQYLFDKPHVPVEYDTMDTAF